MVLEKEIELPEELFEMALKEFECDWKDGKVTIKRFRFGETNAISREAAKIKATTGVGGKMNMDATIDPTQIQILSIMKGVVKAPWTINDKDSIDNLPPPVANWVLAEIDSFNTITFKKKGS